ncbi:MAG: PEP-CTERM sorting domain-containing protein [Verrucomicrobia bacterium]|nr:PEP-CTERM sorting domain-containing protein [Verrucomicrobiota bacterium]
MHPSNKLPRFTLALTSAFTLSIVSAQADFVIYSQNFNSYSNGTPLTSVPNWTDWSGNSVPTIISGKVTVASGFDMLLNMTDVFSHGTNHATIQFDQTSNPQLENTFGPGYLYTFNQAPGSTDFITPQNFTGEKHYLWDLQKSGADITWTALADSTSLIGGSGVRTFTLTDPRGLNTMEWYALGGDGSTLDNFVITGVVPTPEPTSIFLLATGAVALLTRRTRQKLR